MPELPEVETVRRGLAPHLEGRRLVHVEARRPDLRWPLPVDFAQRLQDRTVVALRRRAKYLLAELEDGTVLIAHLGMSGRMLITHGQPPALEKHDHIVLATDRDVWIRFNDARRFGAMDLTTLDALDTHKLLAGLGPEPLSNEFNGPALAAALRAPTGYVAALGSRRSQAARLDRLRAIGFSAQALVRIDGPAGLDIGAIGPAEIALSITAGMVAGFNAKG